MQVLEADLDIRLPRKVKNGVCETDYFSERNLATVNIPAKELLD
jgi:hypothetical protein